MEKLLSKDEVERIAAACEAKHEATTPFEQVCNVLLLAAQIVLRKAAAEL